MLINLSQFIHKLRMKPSTFKCWGGIFVIICFIFVVGNKNISAQMSDTKYGNSGNNGKPILRDKSDMTRQGIPYAGLEKQVFHNDGAKEKIKATVTGLKEAEYTLDEIVNFLEKQNYSAVSISIACLDVTLSFKGKDIHSALINSGFAQEEADAAIPAALRSDNKFLYQTEEIILDKQDLRQPMIMGREEIKSIITTLRRSSVSTPQVVKVLKELGVSAKDIVMALNDIEDDISKAGFRGLGEWKSFQDGRYKNVVDWKNNNSTMTELVQSLNLAGYSVDEIVGALNSLNISSQNLNNILKQARLPVN